MKMLFVLSLFFLYSNTSLADEAKKCRDYAEKIEAVRGDLIQVKKQELSDKEALDLVEMCAADLVKIHSKMKECMNQENINQEKDTLAKEEQRFKHLEDQLKGTDDLTMPGLNEIK